MLATGERNSMVGRVIWTETDEESMAFCQSRPTSPKMSDLPLWALRGVGKSWESAATLGTPKAKAGSTHPLCRRQAPTCSLTEPPVLGMLSNSFVQSLSRVQLFCDPIDYSPPISSVHGISQARIVEWVAISFSRGIFLDQGSNPHLLHWQVDSLPLSHQGSPHWTEDSYFNLEATAK